MGKYSLGELNNDLFLKALADKKFISSLKNVGLSDVDNIIGEIRQKNMPTYTAPNIDDNMSVYSDIKDDNIQQQAPAPIETQTTSPTQRAFTDVQQFPNMDYIIQAYKDINDKNIEDRQTMSGFIPNIQDDLYNRERRNYLNAFGDLGFYGGGDVSMDEIIRGLAPIKEGETQKYSLTQIDPMTGLSETYETDSRGSIIKKQDMNKDGLWKSMIGGDIKEPEYVESIIDDYTQKPYIDPVTKRPIYPQRKIWVNKHNPLDTKRDDPYHQWAGDGTNFNLGGINTIFKEPRVTNIEDYKAKTKYLNKIYNDLKDGKETSVVYDGKEYTSLKQLDAIRNDLEARKLKEIRQQVDDYGLTEVWLSAMDLWRQNPNKFRDELKVDRLVPALAKKYGLDKVQEDKLRDYLNSAIGDLPPKQSGK